MADGRNEPMNRRQLFAFISGGVLAAISPVWRKAAATEAAFPVAASYPDLLASVDFAKPSRAWKIIERSSPYGEYGDVVSLYAETIEWVDGDVIMLPCLDGLPPNFGEDALEIAVADPNSEIKPGKIVGTDKAGTECMRRVWCRCGYSGFNLNRKEWCRCDVFDPNGASDTAPTGAEWHKARERALRSYESDRLNCRGYGTRDVAGIGSRQINRR